jgi:hypothetical protein
MICARRGLADVLKRAKPGRIRGKEQRALRAKTPGSFLPGVFVSDIERRETFDIRRSAGSELHRCTGSGP